MGNQAFVDSLAGREVRRYVDCTDIVTRVPPPVFGYGHGGDMRYVDRKGRLRAAAPSPRDVLGDRAMAFLTYLPKYGWRFWRNVPARSSADHAPINYVSALLGRR